MGILFTVKLFYEKEYVIAFAYAVEKNSDLIWRVE